MKKTWHKEDLINLQPKHDVLIAIDSDGCVFDSMAIKQTRFFHPLMVRHWGLEAVEEEFRETAEWVSLYSPWRGLNRFELLLRIFEQFAKRCPEAACLPATEALRAFVESGVPLSADELARRVEQTGDPELKRVLAWSRAASEGIAGVEEMPVFDGLLPALRQIREAADVIVVSQTAEEALVREWCQAGLAGFADVIAGAELGSKPESLNLAMTGRYPPERTLMIGDAPGDLEAARAAGCLFYPIIPGKEISSWAELRSTALERFLTGTFCGAYQDRLIARFHAALSPVPPWRGSRGLALEG